MNRDVQLEADLVVRSVKRCLRQGIHGLETLPALIKRVMQDELWRERRIDKTEEVIRFESFVDFIITPPPEGLGSTLDLLLAVCRNDLEALDMLNEASRGAKVAYAKREDPSVLASGNARAAAIRRLRDKRPDLHARVLAGELTPHAAMRDAGLRRRTISLPRPIDELAAALRSRLTDREVMHLVKSLSAGAAWPSNGSPVTEDVTSNGARFSALARTENKS